MADPYSQEEEAARLLRGTECRWCWYAFSYVERPSGERHYACTNHKYQRSQGVMHSPEVLSTGWCEWFYHVVDMDERFDQTSGGVYLAPREPIPDEG